jgi:hypothetical protein
MKLHIETQTHENYGAHDWDGKGNCPQYWKAKGGNTYSCPIGSNFDNLQDLVDYLSPQVTHNSEYWRSYVISWSVEDDDYITDFEKFQLEYDGEIQYPVKQLEPLNAADLQQVRDGIAMYVSYAKLNPFYPSAEELSEKAYQ